MTKEETKNQLRAVGRRKSASARVRITEGKGEILINGKPFEKYFPYFQWQQTVLAPLEAVGKKGKLDVSVKIVGGGVKGQATAVQLGISRSLIKYDEEYKKVLKSEGYLTRDSRVKERKKPGLKKARRAPQWKKR
jgi:small subunit ribosomal protein S9